MALDETHGYPLGRLILDYLRSFMWPGVLLLIALFYWEDIFGVIKDRQVNILGVEIGPTVERIQQVEATTQQELQDVAALVETLKANYETELQSAIAALSNGGATAAETVAVPDTVTAVADDIDAKLSSLRENLDREVQQIQAQATRAPQAAQRPPAQAATEAAADSRAARVAAFERAGFEAILARDFEAALENFTEARKTWSDYHNVAEIQRRLAQLKKKGGAPDAAKWAEIDRAILTEFSWGMPSDLRAQFREQIAADAYATRGATK